MKVVDDSCFEDGDCWPPGFRFHPTDEELVVYYLKRKICRRRLKLDIISETDVYKWDPEELPGLSKLKTGDRLWFFFSPRDRKYPNGARSNRATRHGYWKATGKDRTVTCNSRAVGVKKTLVFYKGRAPTGERTDWVMHEYTLDEEELKRCQTAQDYYALYKVFKKSGPGPKNGEQYGAPFREEDWADDDNTVVHNHVDQENSAKQIVNVACVDNTETNGQGQSPFNGIEDFMNRIADCDPVILQPLAVDYGYALHELCEEEAQSTLIDQSLRETNLHERSMVDFPSTHQNDVQASFDLTQSATSQVQRYETSEVTSAPNIYRQETQSTEEDFLEDFIEMDDLIGPEPSLQNIENLQFDNTNGLGELDLFQEAAMFLQDMGPIDLGSVSHSYLNNNELVHPVSHSYYNNHGNEMVNQLDYQRQPHSSDAKLVSSQPWMCDERYNVVTCRESNQGTVPPPPSGVVCDGSSANLPAGVNPIQDQNERGQADDGGDSWFSSALWAFVETIPTTPASASESTAMVNRAFERLSSFGRIGGGVRITAGDTSTAAGNPTATLKKSGSRYNRGFLLFSVIGVVCAILWVLTGTSVKVLGRFIPS